MNKKIKENLHNLSIISDIPEDQIIEMALSRYINPFLNASENLPIINAIYHENNQEIPCHFIEQFLFDNKFYSKIILDGKIKFVLSEYTDILI